MTSTTTAQGLQVLDLTKGGRGILHSRLNRDTLTLIADVLTEEESISSLRNLSSTCIWLFGLTRRQVFKKITFRTQEGRTETGEQMVRRLGQFLEIVRKHPNILGWIESVEVICGTPAQQWLVTDEMRECWKVLGEEAVVKTLKIESTTYGPVRGEYLHSTAWQHIGRNLARLSLIHIRRLDIGSVFPALPYVKALELEGVAFNDFVQEQSTVVGVRPVLQELRYSARSTYRPWYPSVGAMSWVIPEYVDFSAVEKADFRMDHLTDVDMVMRVAKDSADTLSYLKLNPTKVLHDPRKHWNDFDGRKNKIRVLHVWSIYCRHPDNVVRPVEACASGLRKFYNGTQAKIIIEIHCVSLDQVAVLLGKKTRWDLVDDIIKDHHGGLLEVGVLVKAVKCFDLREWEKEVVEQVVNNGRISCIKGLLQGIFPVDNVKDLLPQSANNPLIKFISV